VTQPGVYVNIARYVGWVNTIVGGWDDLASCKTVDVSMAKGAKPVEVTMSLASASVTADEVSLFDRKAYKRFSLVASVWLRLTPDAAGVVTLSTTTTKHSVDTVMIVHALQPGPDPLTFQRLQPLWYSDDASNSDSAVVLSVERGKQFVVQIGRAPRTSLQPESQDATFTFTVLNKKNCGSQAGFKYCPAISPSAANAASRCPPGLLRDVGVNSVQCWRDAGEHHFVFCNHPGRYRSILSMLLLVTDSHRVQNLV
jgi:hypothetical protein